MINLTQDIIEDMGKLGLIKYNKRGEARGISKFIVDVLRRELRSRIMKVS